MLNYSAVQGNQSVLFHYKTRLLSSYYNHLFYNIVTRGVIGVFSDIQSVDINGDVSTQGVKVKILKGLTFFTRPNNKYFGGIITDNYNLLTTVEQNILEQQRLKCTIINDFYVEPELLINGDIDTNKGYLVAEFNYLEFKEEEVNFKFVSNTTGYQIILGQAVFSSGYIQDIDITLQAKSQLSTFIKYNMNVDELNGYHAGNDDGQIPVSNGTINDNLNAEMVNGYSGIDLAEKWQLNTGLNGKYIADEFRIFHESGNLIDNVPLSNKSMNSSLNAEYLNGQIDSYYSDIEHFHSLDNITDGNQFYKKVLNVNASNLVTNDSFNDNSIRNIKLNKECIYAKNDDDGGRLKIITGQNTTSTNMTLINLNGSFFYKPLIMLQIVDDGTGNYDKQHIKFQAIDVTKTHFTFEYTAYQSNADASNFVVIATPTITFQWCAIGYGAEN